MHKKTWVEELEESRFNIDEEADLKDEDLFEEEGPLAGFEKAADQAYDEEFLKEDAGRLDWFEDE
ncbi:hypothetical protein HY492_00325 [Candidatus Woesearchaeota archaeon]|nr:hypothetical protein [Candidatus Woesearchaeota archaeon]